MRVDPSTGDLSWEEAHRRVVPLMRADNRRNLAYLALEYAMLGGSLWACSRLLGAWSAGAVSTPWFVALSAVGVFAMGALQHRLSGLAHDASHYTLFRNRLANELAADILLMFPIMAMTQRFRASHMGHHRHVNDPERDPDLRRLNIPEPQPFPVSKPGFWQRYVVRALLWPPALLRYLFGQAKNANLTVNEGAAIRNLYRFKLGRVMRGTYWITVLTAVHYFRAWPLFFLFWVLPLLTSYPMLMQLREIAHHSNAPDDGDLTNSRVFRVHPLWNACVFPYGQDFHVTHHLFAMLPHYRMAEAHATLMRNPGYRERVVVCRGFFFRTIGTSGPSVLEVLSRKPGPGELVWSAGLPVAGQVPTVV